MTVAATVKTNSSKIVARIKEVGDQEVLAMLEKGNDADLGYETGIQGGVIQAGNTMFVHEIADHVDWIFSHPGMRNHTPIYLGGSAIGKTFAVREGARRAAARMGRVLKIEEFHLANMGPTDISGVPRPETRTVSIDGHLTEVPTFRTIFLPPARLPIVSADPEHALAVKHFDARFRETGRAEWGLMKEHPLYVLFFDEVTNPSMPSVIHSCFSIWHGLFIAEHPLQPDTGVVLAGNRPQDGTSSMSLPRSATTRGDIIEVIPSFSGWLQNWAMQSQRVAVEWDRTEKDDQGYPVATAWEDRPRIHPLIIAYLSRNPSLFSPDASKLPTMQPYPSPRTWTYVSEMLYAAEDAERILGMSVSEKILWTSIGGRIGQGDAALFKAHCQYAKDVPDARKLLNSPAQGSGSSEGWVPYGWLPEKWSTKIDVQMIIATQMVPMINKDNARRFMRFMLDPKYFPPEVSGMTIKLLKPRNILADIVHHWAPDEFAFWAAKFRPLMV